MQKFSPYFCSMQKWAIVIHGGAGAVTRERIGEKEPLYREALASCLAAGQEVLARGGTAIDAVVAAVKALEDHPLFNAGRGSVLNRDGWVEMDAAVMDGTTLQAGAVAAVRRIRNPILAAKAVMEHSEHVLLVGEGAERFAQDRGLDLMHPTYFITLQRWEQYLKRHPEARIDINALGTVGAVALDQQGRIAAATSTGGLMHKLPGRVGDTPLIGAGTYADQQGAAISTTGLGEYFVRLVAAFRTSLYHQQGMALREAVRQVLDQTEQLGGTGGMIAVNARGEIAIDCVSPGMFSAMATATTPAVTFLYQDEIRRYFSSEETTKC